MLQDIYSEVRWMKLWILWIQVIKKYHFIQYFNNFLYLLEIILHIEIRIVTILPLQPDISQVNYRQR